jgi:hypothetical protein
LRCTILDLTNVPDVLEPDGVWFDHQDVNAPDSPIPEETESSNSLSDEDNLDRASTDSGYSGSSLSGTESTTELESSSASSETSEVQSLPSSSEGSDENYDDYMERFWCDGRRRIASLDWVWVWDAVAAQGE